MINDNFSNIDSLDKLLNPDDSSRIWGVKSCAYIKPTIINNEPVWSIYTGEGTMIASAPNPDMAKAIIKSNDMTFATLH